MTRLLRLIATAPLTFEADGGAIMLAPREAVPIPAGITRLRYAHVVIDLESAAAQ